MAGLAKSLLHAMVLIGLGLAVFAALPSARCEAEEAVPPGQTIVVKDDVGREVALHLPIRHAVVFNGATLELIRSIAGLGSVVGVDASSMKERSYWPGLTDTMIVAQKQDTPNYEAIIALHPDILFIPRNGDWQRAATILSPFGIPVVVVTAWDLVRNDFNVDLIGRIYQRQKQAEELTAYCQAHGQMLRRRLAGVEPKSIYLEQERSFTTVLKGSGWNDMITFAGATNIFHDVTAGDGTTARGSNQVFEVDPEEVLRRKPDLIVKLEPESYEPPSAAVSQAALERIAARAGFATLEAVKTRQVYYFSRLLAHPCSKLFGSIQLAKWLYPDRFTDVDPTKEANEWLRDRQGLHPVTPFWARLSSP